MSDRRDEHAAVVVVLEADRLHARRPYCRRDATTVPSTAVRLSVVLGEWLDRPIEADLEVAVAADRLGYGEVWIGEMAKSMHPPQRRWSSRRRSASSPASDRSP